MILSIHSSQVLGHSIVALFPFVLNHPIVLLLYISVGSVSTLLDRAFQSHLLVNSRLFPLHVTSTFPPNSLSLVTPVLAAAHTLRSPLALVHVWALQAAAEEVIRDQKQESDRLDP